MFRNRQKHSRKVFALIALFFVAVQAIGVMFPALAEAKPVTTYTWLDHVTIQGSDGGLWIMKAGDATTYESTATPTDQCQPDNINFPTLSVGGHTNTPTTDGGLLLKGDRRASAVLTTYSPSTSATNTNCQPTTSDITISNPFGHNLQFYWADSNTIVRIAGYAETPADTYTRSDASSNVFLESTGSTCKDSITVSGNSGSYIARTSTQGETQDVSWTQTAKDFPNNVAAHWYANADTASGSGCWQTTPFGIPTIITLPATAIPVQAAGAAGSNISGGSQQTCESSGGPLSWIICGVISTINDAEKAVEGIVTNLLQTRPVVFSASASCTTTDTACSNQKLGATIYKIWSNFRVYGDIVLVIALLVIVFGQSIGGGVIDAYTAKKILPRILIAAILLNLSIYIVAFMEDIINILGNGLGSLMEAPFTTGTGIMSQIKVSGGTGLLLSGALVTIVGGAWIAGLAAFLLFVAGTVLLAALGVLVTLAIRQALLVILLLVSPVAFALYCLPNTEQYFKKWWSLLIKTLLVYPIVMVVFAMAYIGGVVMSNLGITPNILAQTMSVLAVVAPLFLIPFAFKLSGGVIGNVQGMVSGLANKVGKPLRGAAAKSAQGRFTRAQNNQLYDPSSRRGKFGNQLASWATAPGSNLAYAGRNTPFLRKRGQKVASQIHHARMEQSANLLKELNETGMFNDKAYRVLSGAHGELAAGTIEALKDQGLYGRAPSSIQDIDKITKILEGSTSVTERTAAHVLAGERGRLATLYTDPEMGKASVQAAGIMGLSAHGFASSKDIAEVANSMAANGDVDFAQSVASRAQVLGQQSRPDVKAGYGIIYKDGKFVSGISPEAGEDSRALALISSLSSHDLAAAKSKALEELTPTINQVLTTGKASAAGSKSEAEAQAVKDQLFSWAGPYSQASVDVKAQAIEIIRNNGYYEEFQQRSRAEFDPTRRGEGGPVGEGGGGGIGVE